MSCLMASILVSTVQRWLSKLGEAAPSNLLYSWTAPTTIRSWGLPTSYRAPGARQFYTARNPNLIPGTGPSATSSTVTRLIRQNKWERFDAAIKVCKACGHDHALVRFARCVFPQGISGGRYDTFVGVCPSTGRDVRLADYINGNIAPAQTSDDDRKP